MNITLIYNALLIAAGLQLAVAILNLKLVRLMGWKRDLNELPLLLREVFTVHLWFISITLGIFAMLTWRFATDIALGTNPMARWVAGCIAIFWGIRTIIQVTYYSSSHWQGIPKRILAHIILFLLYGSFTVIYSLCAFN